LIEWSSGSTGLSGISFDARLTTALQSISKIDQVMIINRLIEIISGAEAL